MKFTRKQKKLVLLIGIFIMLLTLTAFINYFFKHNSNIKFFELIVVSYISMITFLAPKQFIKRNYIFLTLAIISHLFFFITICYYYPHEEFLSKFIELYTVPLFMGVVAILVDKLQK